MDIQTIYQVILFLVGLVYHGVDCFCTPTDIKNCVAVLIRGGDPSDAQVVMEKLLYDRISINDWCRNAPRLMRCLERQMEYCIDTEKLMLQGFNNMLRNLCVGDIPAKEAHRQCAQQSRVRQDQQSCNNLYTSEMNEVQRAPPKSAMKMLCRVTRKQLKCLWEGMNDNCGKGSAQWQYKVHRAMIQPTMDYADCDLDDAGLSTGAIVGIVIACLAGVTIIMLIIIYCIRKT